MLFPVGLRVSIRHRHRKKYRIISIDDEVLLLDFLNVTRGGES